MESSLIVGGHEDCAFEVLGGEKLEVPQIIGSCGLETINNRIRLVDFLAHLTLLDQIGSSD